MKLNQLKQIALEELNLTREQVRKFGDLRRKETWESAITHQHNAAEQQLKAAERIKRIVTTQRKVQLQIQYSQLEKLNIRKLKAIATDLNVSRSDVKKYGGTHEAESWLSAIREAWVKTYSTPAAFYSNRQHSSNQPATSERNARPPPQSKCDHQSQNGDRNKTI